MSSEQNLPERPAAASGAAEGGEGGEKLSKKALKKLEKEREKVGHIHCTRQICLFLTSRTNCCFTKN